MQELLENAFRFPTHYLPYVFLSVRAEDKCACFILKAASFDPNAFCVNPREGGDKCVWGGGGRESWKRGFVVGGMGRDDFFLGGGGREK